MALTFKSTLFACKTCHEPIKILAQLDKRSPPPQMRNGSNSVSFTNIMLILMWLYPRVILTSVQLGANKDFQGELSPLVEKDYFSLKLCHDSSGQYALFQELLDLV